MFLYHFFKKIFQKVVTECSLLFLTSYEMEKKYYKAPLGSKKREIILAQWKKESRKQIRDAGFNTNLLKIAFQDAPPGSEEQDTASNRVVRIQYDRQMASK